MSEKAHRFRPRNRHLCARCGEKRNGYVIKGVWRRDSQHDLCKRCYQAEIDRVRKKFGLAVWPNEV